MNAAAKPTRRRSPPARTARHRDAGGTLLGIFIGLVLGLGLAAGVAYYLMRANGPFPTQAGKEAREVAKEGTRNPRADATASDKEKPRFDFYKILPGVEEPKVQAEAKRPTPDKATVEQAKAGGDKASEKPADRGDKADVAKVAEKTPDKMATAAPTTAAKLPERFWLQAGSFASESDAENLKARLAFAGWQASVQQGTLPDKGTRYRVRLGPFDNPEEVSRIRGDLARSGFDVAVIRF
ncbi:MAG: SPOR domain-containing protein [Burkholderiales bacterium]|nr:SPOR domain-containing protein [Burkholderiales bacterium]